MNASTFSRAAEVLRNYAAMIEESEVLHSGPMKGRCAPDIEAEIAEYRELANKLESHVSAIPDNGPQPHVFEIPELDGPAPLTNHLIGNLVGRMLVTDPAYDYAQRIIAHGQAVERLFWRERKSNHSMISLLAKARTDRSATRRATVSLKVRPLLVSGMLATADQGAVILIDSEQGEAEQVKTLWHEVLHVLGLTDEQLVEHIAGKLAAADPGILRTLAPLINVPSDTTDSKPEGT